ncbi:hypothetical protein Bbelb_347550 [Branchiostoma belcheri]|nr:hypothetical protein Bbelb_347550 [Branchiostoma belcheri]
MRKFQRFVEVTFETAPVRHVLGVDAGRRHDAERAPYCQGHNLRLHVGACLCSGRRLSLISINFCDQFLSGTRPVPGQSPVLTRAACGRVPTGSYSSAGQLSGPWRVPGGIPTGSSRVFEQAGACSAARRVPGSEVTASLRRISPNGARSVLNSELKSIRRPRGAKNRPAAVGKPASLRPATTVQIHTYCFGLTQDTPAGIGVDLDVIRLDGSTRRVTCDFEYQYIDKDSNGAARERGREGTFEIGM